MNIFFMHQIKRTNGTFDKGIVVKADGTSEENFAAAKQGYHAYSGRIRLRARCKHGLRTGGSDRHGRQPAAVRGVERHRGGRAGGGVNGDGKGTIYGDR